MEAIQIERATETVIWNRCSYKVPSVVGTNAPTKKNHKFYNSMVKEISV